MTSFFMILETLMFLDIIVLVVKTPKFISASAVLSTTDCETDCKRARLCLEGGGGPRSMLIGKTVGCS